MDPPSGGSSDAAATSESESETAGTTDDETASSGTTSAVETGDENDVCLQDAGDVQNHGTYFLPPHDWPWETPGQITVDEVICDGISRDSYEGSGHNFERVYMSCVRTAGGIEPTEMNLGSSLVEAVPLLDEIFEGEQVTIRFAGAPDPEFGGIRGFSVRDEDGDIRLLSVYEFSAGVGETLPAWGGEGWFAPIDRIDFVDAGCDWLNRPDVVNRRPHALDLVMGDEIARVHDREILDITIDGDAYRITVPSAAEYDCWHPSCIYVVNMTAARL